MKNALNLVAIFSIVACASMSMANPKCSHRSGNDISKNTNPVKIAKASVDTSAQTVRKGTK